MDIQEMMHRLLVKMDDSQAKAGETRKEMLERMDTNQVKMEADRKASHEEMMAMIKAWGKTLDAWSTDTKVT
jgi:hypothetical protein